MAAAEQLALQWDQGMQVLLAGHLLGRQNDAGLQEALQPPQQLRTAPAQVGVPAEHLRDGGGVGWGVSREGDMGR